MKKSEMRRLLAAVGVTFARPDNLPLEGAGDKILRRMEEEGQTWDPEEPLPERLEAPLCGAWPILRPAGGSITAVEAIPVYREAVRRWNAWGRLEVFHRNLVATGRHGHAEHLRQILDGKGGE